MNELRGILSDTVTRLLPERVTPEVRESAEKGAWPATLWQQVEENGLTLTPVPEARGGGGGTWQDAHVVVTAAGRFAVPLPLAETMLGGWLLAETGLDAPMGPLTVAPVHDGDRLQVTRHGAEWRLSGVATRVPWGRAAQHVVVVADGSVALVAAGAAVVEPDVNLALEPRDTLKWQDAPVVAAAPAASLSDDSVRLYGALVRSAQMAGAL